jgi:hypothetical protein
MIEEKRGEEGEKRDSLKERDFTCVDAGQGAYLSFLSQSAFFFRKAPRSLKCNELIQESPKTTYRGFKPVPFKIGIQNPRGLKIPSCGLHPAMRTTLAG